MGFLGELPVSALDVFGSRGRLYPQRLVKALWIIIRHVPLECISRYPSPIKRKMFQESNRAKRASKLYSAVCEHRLGAGVIDSRHQNLEIRL